MEYTILDGAETTLSIFCPAGFPDPVTNRCLDDFDCFSNASGSFYSKEVKLSFKYYFVYDAPSDNLQFYKYGVISVANTGIAKGDNITFTTAIFSPENPYMKSSKSYNSILTCPVKFVDKNKITFEVLSRLFPVRDKIRELPLSHGSCVIYKRLYFDYEYEDDINQCHVISGTTITKTFLDKTYKGRPCALLVPDNNQRAEVNYHLSKAGLQARVSGVLCCDGDLHIIVNVPYNDIKVPEKGGLAFIGDHNGLSIVRYRRINSETAELVLLHQHPINFEFTLVNL